ncbi:UDP-forming cellulose synthase catalytic subunit (plasmid) [Sphingobium sp. V4]|uniref:UDP-forming cellulose synthase catalytic subunit n=1 Tax=Sphingobium sp. V4 TaxID=3038927 RepID=UPI002557C7B1|nr:UDP-forming cellulose synthase catalytic subunit [Sphingobium sp. V4]WIW90447.1 UDP-forming cellulose synthase catalytic subunit [Sphingobium sp. V4]
MKFLSSQPAKWLALLCVAPLTLLVIGVPLDLDAQWLFTGITIVGAIGLGRSPTRKATLTLGILSLLVSTRYMFWRTTQTLEFGTLPEFLLGSGLYLAEIYAWVILLLGFLQTSWPLNRPVVEIAGEPEHWPVVDVFIPTYNESLSIVRNTVFAALDMDYPADRFRVFILDDGRRPEFRAFARQVGCGYLTRADNLHAKAGNLNAAMNKTRGELIAIFDCDHVPTRAFLQMTVGWFQKDPKLALMQTPHHFYSPDPAQRNLRTVDDLPGEGDLFYGNVQGGNDLWNAAFFCGSCAIIRREALTQTNGFAGETVTEDAHTALKLQRMGWNTAYISARLSAGLATERLVLHIGQRIRWARGMTQIMRIDNPLLGPGLKWQQRLCYLNAMLHFQFPLPRIVFLTSPLAYLIFGQNIIHASASLIFAYAAPHLYCSMVWGARSQGGERRPFWGEIYETILAFHLIPATVLTLFNPRKGKFNVTDKGSLLDRTYFDLGTVKPHLICIALMLLGVTLGFVKWLFFPHLFNIQSDTLILNTLWAGFSLIILLAAVSVARETRQAREHIRIETQVPVTIYLRDGHVFDAMTTDLSMGGAAILLPPDVSLRDRMVTHISLPMGDEKLTLPVDNIRSERTRAFLSFQPLDVTLSRHLVRAILGRADAWQPVASPRPVSGLRSLWDIIVVDFTTLKRLFRLNRTERRTLKREQAKLPGAPATKAAAGLLLAAGALFAMQQSSRAQTPGVARIAATPASAAGARQQRLNFRDLQIRSPIRLQGTRGEIGIPFGMRRNDVVTNASLTLNLAWSPAMLGDLSQLVVLLNGEVVGTLPLHPGDAAGQIVKIPVNPALFLPGDNRLNLRLLGHYTRDCEDPFHSSLWANISNVRSWFDLTIQSLPLAPDLARLPGPFFDRHDNLPLRLPFVFAGRPGNGELEAAASVASWFGGMASYRGFSFKPLLNQLPQGNGVVFLLGNRSVAGLTMQARGPSVAVVRNPRDNFGELLVVMGRNVQELKLAAAGIASGRGVFGGAQMSFDNVRIPTYPRYSAPRWISTDRPVRLGELTNAYALQGLGLPPGPLSTRFRITPDLFFWPRQGGRLDLRYRYPTADWLDKRGSRLDVSINNQYLRTLPVAGGDWWDQIIAGKGAVSQDSHASVVLPRYNLFGQNELVFDYNLMLANKKKCKGTLPDNVRVSISPTSTIDFSHAYHALQMPDLATFAGAGYPFTIRPDLAETVIVMGRDPSLGAIEAFLALMGRFADSTGLPATHVTVASTIEPSAMEGKDILVLGSSSVASSEQLFGSAPVRFYDGALHVAERSALQSIQTIFALGERSSLEEAEQTIYNATGFSGIVGFRSPFDSGRSVVALLANDPNALPQLVNGMADTKINAQIQGDLAVTDGEGMTSFAVGPTYWVGSLPVWMRIAYWFSQRPILMAASGLLLALFLAGPAYLYLNRQAKRRLAAADEA